MNVARLLLAFIATVFTLIVMALVVTFPEWAIIIALTIFVLSVFTAGWYVLLGWLAEYYYWEALE